MRYLKNILIKTNKNMIESDFLTLTQVRELMKLGMNFSDYNWEFRELIPDEGYGELPYIFEKDANLTKGEGYREVRISPTLFVTEMLDFLPCDITYKEEKYYLSIEKYCSLEDGQIYFFIAYKSNSGNELSVNEHLFRDALCTMLKLLLNLEII